jgi:hypothetical protein
MTLGNMPSHGVPSTDATCRACQHEATVFVDALPNDLLVPDVTLKMECSNCGPLRRDRP